MKSILRKIILSNFIAVLFISGVYAKPSAKNALSLWNDTAT